MGIGKQSKTLNKSQIEMMRIESVLDLVLEFEDLLEPRLFRLLVNEWIPQAVNLVSFFTPEFI